MIKIKDVFKSTGKEYDSKWAKELKQKQGTPKDFKPKGKEYKSNFAK